MDIKDVYGLEEISKWAMDDEVDLPTVQRGFVWKPHQIEELWDSLLRGYPVGAFVLSPNNESNMPSFLLDGQQRATAICLGFGAETFRQSQDKIKVFIDLVDPKKGDNRKYIFRVITRSHPWGYQRNDNTKPLDSDNIQKAMKLYREEDHLAASSLDPFFPYDAVLPVPFEFFLNSTSVTEVMKSIDQWKHWEIIKNEFIKKKIPPFTAEEFEVKSKVDKIFNVVNKMLDSSTGRKIPTLTLNFAELTSASSGEHGLIQVDGLDDDNEDTGNKTDEIENIFIRLNAGGTPLRGEELNYSILKAHIDKNIQDDIEKSCHGLFNPARFITIAYRLYQLERSTDSRDAISMRIKPKQFQKTIGDNKIEFFKFILNRIIKSGSLDYVRNILEYNKDHNPYGLPYLFFSKLSAEAPELMFMLLYRVIIKGDKFDNMTIRRRMIGMLLLLSWFGKNDKRRDHKKLLSNIWPCVRSLKMEQFWTASTIQRAKLDSVLSNIPNKEKISALNNPKNKLPNSNTYIWGYLETKCQLGDSAYKMFNNKDLILYAQRHSLSVWFKDENYNLDDTNVPFDWDHISPNNYIRRKRGINDVIRELYNTNGNFRAWPYTLNRFDQDDNPATKFKPWTDSKWSKNRDKYFSKLNKFNKTNISTNSDLTSKLLEWSFCTDEWSNCDVSDFKRKEDWRTLYRHIINRNVNILIEWYDSLLIDSLITNVSKSNFSQIFYKKVWINNPDILVDLIDYDGYDYWVSEYNINGSIIYIYFGHSKDIEEILIEDEIEFGIVENQIDGYLSKIIIPEKERWQTNPGSLPN